MNELTHLDVNPTGQLTTPQEQKLRTALLPLSKEEDFKETSFYLGGEYIGGRPNDRG